MLCIFVFMLHLHYVNKKKQFYKNSSFSEETFTCVIANYRWDWWQYCILLYVIPCFRVGDILGMILKKKFLWKNNYFQQFMWWT